MQVFLVRHAHAGQRKHNGRDIYRPLSEDGHQRAEDLIEVFAGQRFDQILSSPATRCVQTLEPLAKANDMQVIERQALWEGSSIADALAALEEANVERLVACSHGDIIPALIDNLNGQGVAITGHGCELGSIWVLEFEDGGWQSARYVGSSDNALA